MDDHVASNLTDVQAVIPDLEKTHRLIGNDVEDKDLKRMVADIYQHTLQDVFMSVYPLADVVGHQETEQGRDGEREELRVGGTPVHVCRQVF